MKEYTLEKKFNWELAHDRISSGSGSTSNLYLGKEHLGGIIFNLYKGEDGLEHGHVVSLNENDNLAWQNPASLVGADKSWDGATNTSLMSSSPAKAWVNNTLGADWYIPSIDELNILYNSRYYVNKAISTLGGYLLNIDSNYWSSTEKDSSTAFFYNFENGDISYNLKNLPSYVRGIKSF